MRRRPGSRPINSALAEQAGDALGNIVLVQSFVRLAAETRKLRDAMDQLIAVQFPVLNWWALLTVLSGASSTITLIAIFALGTWLHLHGQATVGEIVTFMGLATQLIGRMDQAIELRQPAVLPRAEARRVLRCAGHAFDAWSRSPTAIGFWPSAGAGRVRAG